MDVCLSVVSLLRFDFWITFNTTTDPKPLGLSPFCKFVSKAPGAQHFLMKPFENEAQIDGTHKMFTAKMAAGVLGSFQKTQYTRELFFSSSGTFTVCHLSNPFQSFVILQVANHPSACRTRSNPRQTYLCIQHYCIRCWQILSSWLLLVYHFSLFASICSFAFLV